MTKDEAQTSVKRTLLGYELTTQQDALVNYLMPSIGSCLLFIILIASDIGVVYRHYIDGNPIWASLTIFVIYLPVLGCYTLITSDWDLWPELEGCSMKNIQWFLLKTLQHLLFPVWSMWRYAERIFWSIEALTATDEDLRSDAKSIVAASRTIELYIFLQAYLHALPQILLQIYILMRYDSDMNKQTIDGQIMSLVFNLAKMSITTTYYQRFKTQKLAGKQYPWLKLDKKPVEDANEVNMRRMGVVISQAHSVIEKRPVTSTLEDHYDLEPAAVSVRRRSSDIYLEPLNNYSASSDTESFIGFNQERNREAATSIVDGPQRQLYREETSNTFNNFNIRRVVYIKGLPEDDLAGKLIAFCWWFCFLIARILAIAAFTYFYPKPSIWLMCSHVAFVLACLVYDVKTDAVKRSKALFFLFISLIYIFCIIEFKIKFKKANLIYYGYFALVFAENSIMCLVWWFSSDTETLENEFWFRYVFYLVVMCTIISFSSMLFYLNINKPDKIVVDSRIL